MLANESQDTSLSSSSEPQPTSPAPRKPLVALTIAGFDPSSGAGITADLQTFAAHRLFGTAAITTLTVQSTLGVACSEPVAPALLRGTLRYICTDLPPAGIKIGALGSVALADVVGEFLREWKLVSSSTRVVFDPVLSSSSGRELFPAGELDRLHARVLPFVDCLTPNAEELALLTGRPTHTSQEITEALHALGQRHPNLAIVSTGGDSPEPENLAPLPPRRSVDHLRLPSGELFTFTGKRVETTSTHGTGCAFSSALLAALLGGLSLPKAVQAAKLFVEQALRHAPGLGRGRGPLDLLWPLRPPHAAQR